MKNYILQFSLGILLWSQGAFGADAMRAIFLSGNQTRVGCVYKPAGHGPFPTVIFNQNSTKSIANAEHPDPFPALADFYTSHGYVLFVPGRHKLDSEQTSQRDREDISANSLDPYALPKILGDHATQIQNIEASLVWLKAQSFVDDKRIVMTGQGVGGIDTLLLAEKELGLRGFIVFSPAAALWRSYPSLQHRLKTAVKDAKSPLFIIQVQNDVDTTPTIALGKELESKGIPNTTKIYSAFENNLRQPSAFAETAVEIWGNDALDFLNSVMP